MDIIKELVESPTIRHPISYRDIMRTISFLINYLPFINNMHYVPERVYIEDDENKVRERIYSELHILNWWWEI